MFKSFVLLVSLIGLMSAIPAIPVNKSHDFLTESQIELHQLANVLMSPHIGAEEHDLKVFNPLSLSSSSSLSSLGLHSSHMFNVSKDSFVGAFKIPNQVMIKSTAVGGAIPAASAVGGAAVGSVIATPIILKAIALPGIAAAKTASAAAMTASAAAKTASAAVKTGAVLKSGALGLASKGILMAKKGAYVAGRIILKPIAIITGAHLKVLGSGLAGAGKLVTVTGAKIAKTGTAVKFAGLGSIGVGASAISWGLDKTTIDTHFQESQQKLKISQIS